MDNQQGPTVQHVKLYSMLCGSLDGRGVWRMDTWKCMVESLCCSSETTITLLTGYNPIKFKVKKKKCMLLIFLMSAKQYSQLQTKVLNLILVITRHFASFHKPSHIYLKPSHIFLFISIFHHPCSGDHNFPKASQLVSLSKHSPPPICSFLLLP